MTRRPWPAGLVLAGVCVLAPSASVAQTKQECADAYVAGQLARKEGRLGDAHDKLAICADAACPAALRGDCASWSQQVDKDRPGITVSVTGPAEGAVPDARITVDGRRSGAGSQVLVDPGEHVVRVEAGGMKPAEQRVSVALGQRRELTVRLEREAPAPAPEPPPAPSFAAPVALGVVGVVGLGVFAGLGVAGNGKKSALDALGCKPNCSPGDVSTVKTLYVSADVALGVGLASLAAAGVLLVTRLVAARSSSPTPAAWITIEPRRGGSAVTVRF